MRPLSGYADITKAKAWLRPLFSCGPKHDASAIACLHQLVAGFTLDLRCSCGTCKHEERQAICLSGCADFPTMQWLRRATRLFNRRAFGARLDELLEIVRRFVPILCRTVPCWRA